MPQTSAADKESKRLSFRYILALTIIAALSLLGHAAVQLALSSLTHDSYIINVAGKQRMLSQRLGKTVLVTVLQDSQDFEGLKADLKTFVEAHEGLRDETLGNFNSERVKTLFTELTVDYDNIVKGADVAIESGSLTKDELDLFLQASENFLPKMNEIVSQYETDSAGRVFSLRSWELGILSLTLLSLVLVALYIFQPAVERIRVVLLDSLRSREKAELNQLRLGETNLILNHVLLRVKEASTKVESAGHSVSKIARDQESRILEQASSATQINASAKGITETTVKLSDTMDQMVTEASASSDLATEARESLSKLQSAWSTISGSCTSIGDRLTNLNQKSEDITAVLNTITQLADQTNLISLNAAIEAEKAGQHGKGFNVVALEVRRLSDQTAVATLDIEATIEEMRKATAQSAESVDKLAAEIKEGETALGQVVSLLSLVIHKVHQLDKQFLELSSGMQKQSEGAQQINASIGDLSQLARATVTTLEEFKDIVLQLDEATSRLQTETETGDQLRLENAQKKKGQVPQ